MVLRRSSRAADYAPPRNKGLELAKKLNKPCVQLSDDLKTISFVSSKEDKNWTKPSSHHANLRAKSAQIEPVSPGRGAVHRLSVQTNFI